MVECNNCAAKGKNAEFSWGFDVIYKFKICISEVLKRVFVQFSRVVGGGRDRLPTNHRVTHLLTGVTGEVWRRSQSNSDLQVCESLGYSN